MIDCKLLSNRNTATNIIHRPNGKEWRTKNEGESKSNQYKSRKLNHHHNQLRHLCSSFCDIFAYKLIKRFNFLAVYFAQTIFRFALLEFSVRRFSISHEKRNENKNELF